MISVQNKFISFVLFASGEGSNAENLWRFFSTSNEYKVVLLICDREDAPVIQKARNANIPYKIISKVKMDTRTHEQLILNALKKVSLDFILLCGYRRLLSKEFVEKYSKKIINIHPSLLPKYPGLHAYERAYHEGEALHGATVHFVDQGMDTGEIILQKSFRRLSHESFIEFKKRGMELEYQLYPEAIIKVVSNLKSEQYA